MLIRSRLSSATGQHRSTSSSGTTVTFGLAHGLVAGDLIGNETNGYRTVLTVTSDTVVEVDRAFSTDLTTSDALKKQASTTDVNVKITGFIGGHGLTNISIHTGGSITLAEGATISSRQVGDDADHWNAVSGTNSGGIILKAQTITVGGEANILAHANGTNAATGEANSAGDVRLIVNDEVRKEWQLLGIPDFNWSEAESGVEIGVGARIKGNNISIDASAWSGKALSAENDVEFSFPTRSVLLADLDADLDLDLIVGNYAKPNRFYLNDGTGSFGYGTDIDSTAYHTTSLAFGDVDNDRVSELIVGNYDESWDLGKSLRIYEWDSATKKFGAGTDITGGDKRTSSIALANTDADDNLELIVGTNGEGIFLYDWSGSGFGSPTQIESATTYRNTSLAVGDLDGDNITDIIIAGSYLPGEKTIALTGWSNEAEENTSHYYASAATPPGKVFRNGNLLTQVYDKASLGSDTWWYDVDQDRLYTYGDPAGSEIRISSVNGESTELTGWSNVDEANSSHYYASAATTPDKVFRNGNLLTQVNDKVYLDSADEWWYDVTQDRVYTYGDPAGSEICISSVNGESLGQLIRFYKKSGTGFEAGVNVDTATHKTTALVLGNVDADAAKELIVGTDGQGILQYEFNGTGFTPGGAIDTASYNTTALTLGDADGDSDLDLVVGNTLQQNRLYLNTSGSFIGQNIGIEASATTALALGDLDKWITGWKNTGEANNEYYYVSRADAPAQLFREGSALTKVGSKADLDNSGEWWYDSAQKRLYTYSDPTGDRITENQSDNRLELVVGIDRLPNQEYHFLTETLTGWEREAASDYYSISSSTLPDTVFRAGTTLTKVAAKADLDNANKWWYDTAQKRLYVYSDPGSNEIKGSYTGYAFGRDIGVDSSLLLGADPGSGPDVSSKKAKAVVSEAETRILIGAGAYIEAANDVILTSLAHAEAKITTVRSGWGVTYGNASAKAEIEVLNGAFIHAGNDFQMKATSERDVNVLTFIPSVGESNNIAVSLAIGVSNTDAEIRSGAQVSAKNAEITAENFNSFRNTAIAAGFGTAVNTDDETGEEKSDETGVGATLVLGFNQSQAKAGVSGLVTTTEDTVINATSTSEHNVTRSFASASGNTAGKYADEIKGFTDELPMDFGIGDDVMRLQSGEGQKKAYAVAFAMITVDNSASAFLGDGAVIKAQDLSVTSHAEDAFQISASGSAGTVPGSDLETSFGGALAYSKVANRANAFIGWNAIVDVTGNVTVDSEALMTSPVEPLDLTLALLGLGEATQAEALGAAYAYSEKMGGEVGNAVGSPLFEEEDFVDVQLASLVTQLRAGGTEANETVARFLWGKFSQETRDLLNNPAATADQLKKALKEEFNKIIQERASIYTQDRFSGITLRDETKAVGDTNKDGNLDNADWDTDQDGDIDSDDANQADLVRFNRMLLEDAYETELVKRSNVIADYLMENLNDEEKIGTSFVHAGASDAAGGMAAGAGINVLYSYNAATSGIAKGAKVLADQDVNVNATGTVASINMAGNTSVLNYAYNALESPKTGIGGFLDAVMDQNYATAYIDDLAFVHANNISVKADTDNDLLTIAMAGGYADAKSLDGAFIYDRIENAALAYIEDRAVVEADNDLTVNAQSDIQAITITPALSIGGQYGVGIGASFAHIMDTTQAFIGDLKDSVPPEGFGDGALTGTVTVGGNLSLYARSTPEIWTIGASAGVAPGAD